MGKIVAFRNPTNKYLTVGNKTVGPGETREVDEDHIQPSFKKEKSKKKEEKKLDPFLTILKSPVVEITKVIQGRNEDGSAVITTEDLDRLEQGEESGKNRIGVIAAITEEQLFRANETLDDGTVGK